jgi:RNA polymerase sigma factor (sigma-70 family)
MSKDDLLPTRNSLLGRLKDWGDQASWQDFFNNYWRLIYGVAIKAGLSDAEAQDVVQETVIAVARKIKDFEVGSEHGSFKAWLLNLTRWRITDQFRKRPKLAAPREPATGTSTRTSTADRIPDPASLDLDAVWNQEWEQSLAETAMRKVQQQVSASQYQMFQLHVMKEWPARQVARKLGVKLSQVYFAKYRITRLMKKEVKRLEAELF